MTKKFTTANKFSLYGGALQAGLIIQEFDGVEINLEVTDNVVGMDNKGNTVQQPRPGNKSFGTPTFVCPLDMGILTIWNWWKGFYPTTGKNGRYEPMDLFFNFGGNDGEVIAEWILKDAFPMKYSISGGKPGENSLAAETVQLCVTEIVRKQ